MNDQSAARITNAIKNLQDIATDMMDVPAISSLLEAAEIDLAWANWDEPDENVKQAIGEVQVAQNLINDEDVLDVDQRKELAELIESAISFARAA